MELLAVYVKGRRYVNWNERQPQSQNLVIEPRRVLLKPNRRRFVLVRLKRQRLHLLVRRPSHSVQLNRHNIERPKRQAPISILRREIGECRRRKHFIYSAPLSLYAKNPLPPAPIINFCSPPLRLVRPNFIPMHS